MGSGPGTTLTIPYVTPGEAYTASILLPLLGLVFVSLRLYSGALQKKAINVDDWLMLPALFLVIGMGVTLIIGIAGKAIAYPTPYEGDLTREQRLTSINPTIRLMGIVQYVFILLMVLAYGFIKLSITLFYRRIFVASKGTIFDWATVIATVMVVLWTVAFFFANMFPCGIHISANWGSVLEAKTYCQSTFDVSNALVVSDLVTDVVLLCLPLPVIWNLHMTKGRKLVVTGILATGAVAIVASIVKVVISYEITNAGLDADVDPDLTVSTILHWSMIEAGLAIIAACLPTLRFLMNKISFDSIMRSVRSALSISSMRSQRSQETQASSQGPYSNLKAESSVGSQSYMVPEKGATDTYVMGNQEGVQGKGRGIKVTRQISQHDSMV